mmetsp:Transcript_7303/g.6486  ORF Transcript_7303/g.6486 Transcript_7303/m.6486 type:complete len:153 (-) Transcript_7303:34-492(-)
MPSEVSQENIDLNKVGGEFDFLTNEFTNDLLELPSFISEFPPTLAQSQGSSNQVGAALSVFDVFFSLDQSHWVRFNLEREVNSTVVQYHNLPISLKHPQSIFVPTMESMRYHYLMECLVASNHSLCIIGPQAIGKSVLIKEFLFKTLFTFSD